METIVDLGRHERWNEMAAFRERIQRRAVAFIKRRHIPWRVRKHDPVLAETLLGTYRQQYDVVRRAYFSVALSARR
jgi:hypothetical protein